MENLKNTVSTLKSFRNTFLNNSPNSVVENQPITNVIESRIEL